ncbi:hypothetical protein [Streptomyces milbemycinicus]|uniref:Uncharacterized protein n=1 Tax=Streptomyces milbemycinicus TaxID=476552 RepID=A0ABW8LNX7_9ACTN
MGRDHRLLADVEYRAEQMALAGVLDNRPFTTPAERAWTFRTVGHGHGAETDAARFIKPLLH